jgi:MFS family permease
MFGATRREIQMMPVPVWLLLAGTVINRFGSFVVVFLALYITRHGYTAAEAGMAVSAYGVGGLFAAITGGYLTDRIGRRRTIALSMFSAAIVMIALSQTTALPRIIILAALAGLTSELYRPASAAYLTDLTRPGERLTAFALYRLAINLGSAAGPAVGGFIAERSFTILFVGDGLTSLIFGILALGVLPSTRHTREGRTEEGGRIRDILSDGRFMIFLSAAVLAAFVYFQAYSTFPVQVSNYGFPSRTYGMLIGLNGLIVLLFEIPLTAFTRRFDPRRVMAIGAVLFGAGFGMIGISGSLPLLVTAIAVLTLGEIAHAPIAGAFVADLSPKHMRGRYMGAFHLAYGVGIVFGPVVGAAVLQQNPAILWTACFILGLIGAILILSIRKSADGSEPPVTGQNNHG